MTARPLDVHRVSLESLRAIAAGSANEAELHLLCSAQRSQLLLVLRALLDHFDEAARRTRHPGGFPPGGVAWRLLCTTERHAPEAVEMVLADPTVMAWALRLLRRLGGSAAKPASAAPLWAELGQFHALAAAAAVRAGVPAMLRVPAHRGMVWLPGAGMAGPVARRRWSEAQIRVGREGAVVHGELAQVRLSRPLPASAPGWRPLRPVRGLAPCADEKAQAGPWLDTVTPYRDFTRYPRSPGRSGERRLRLWEDRVAGAYALLDRESPADAAALRAFVRVLVPRSFRTAGGGLVASASSLDAFGAVTLSLPYDETQAAAVLVHETRHQQLNALLSLVHLVRVTEDEPGESTGRLYFAPWRSDPRPVRGLFHGVFAFAGVARFWRTHRRHVTGNEAQRADFEFAVLREQLQEAVAVLVSDDGLTEAGRVFVEEIAALVGTWQEDVVSDRPGALARHYCALRRSLWRARHLEITRSAAEQLAAAWAAGHPAPALPISILRPRPDLIRLDTFGPLARYFLSAPEPFARRRRQEENGDPARRAEYAAVAGNAEEAALGYTEWAARDSQNIEAWIGAALALPEHARGAGVALLLDRPEVVAGVHRAIAAVGGSPAPLDLAAWLGADGTGLTPSATDA
ncbi:HEXXH motif-containing putative peptide modification protein [Streptomyces sp. NPDC002838]|uniref:aKG-HExxH-type peptide beta-hydroxylase n=1 Tax=Streptomyces sp. NPDC002838 TaxID=3154436 RepID=UPI003320303A